MELLAAHMDQALHQLKTGVKNWVSVLLCRKRSCGKNLKPALRSRHFRQQTMWTSKEDFITQDEIDHRLGRGSGFSHGSFRIYEYFKEGHDSKEAADFLKKNTVQAEVPMHLQAQTTVGKIMILKVSN